MKTILIFIDHEIVFRNFVYPKTFDKLSKSFNVVFVFPEENNKRFNEINLNDFNLPGPFIRLKVNQARQSLWNDRLFSSDFRFSLDRQKRAIKSFRKKTLGWKASLIYSFLSLPLIYSIFLKINNYYLNNKQNDDLIKILDKYKPKLILHPSVLNGVYINDLIFYSKKRSIKSMIIINSWDNPSTKRAVANNPDILLVWGAQTKQHALKYLKMEESSVKIFGAPQFDKYFRKSNVTRPQFETINSIKKNQKIILYAGSSKKTKEIDHLRYLDNLISKYALKNITILYRPHPWGLGGKGGEKLFAEKWKHIKIEKSMINYLSSLYKGKVYKELKDPNLMHDILSNVDAIISPLSTVILEAAIHGKPSICFLPVDDGSMDLEENIKLIHFSEIFNSKYFIISKNTSDFDKDLFKLVKIIDDKKIKRNLIQFSRYFVKNFNKNYNIRLNNFIKILLKA